MTLDVAIALLLLLLQRVRSQEIELATVLECLRSMSGTVYFVKIMSTPRLILFRWPDTTYLLYGERNEHTEVMGNAGVVSQEKLQSCRDNCGITAAAELKVTST